MPRIFLFIAVSIVHALSTPVFNNLALYETCKICLIQYHMSFYNKDLNSNHNQAPK